MEVRIDATFRPIVRHAPCIDDCSCLTIENSKASCTMVDRENAVVGEWFKHDIESGLVVSTVVEWRGIFGLKALRTFCCPGCG